MTHRSQPSWGLVGVQPFSLRQLSCTQSPDWWRCPLPRCSRAMWVTVKRRLSTQAQRAGSLALDPHPNLFFCYPLYPHNLTLWAQWGKVPVGTPMSLNIVPRIASCLFIQSSFLLKCLERAHDDPRLGSCHPCDRPRWSSGFHLAQLWLLWTHQSMNLWMEDFSIPLPFR